MPILLPPQLLPLLLQIQHTLHLLSCRSMVQRMVQQGRLRVAMEGRLGTQLKLLLRVLVVVKEREREEEHHLIRGMGCL